MKQSQSYLHIISVPSGCGKRFLKSRFLLFHNHTHIFKLGFTRHLSGDLFTLLLNSLQMQFNQTNVADGTTLQVNNPLEQIPQSSVPEYLLVHPQLSCRYGRSATDTKCGTISRNRANYEQPAFQRSPLLGNAIDYSQRKEPRKRTQKADASENGV